MLSFNMQGYAPNRARGVVLPGEITDLGSIVLVTEEEGIGWIEGRVVNDDGTPALGAAIMDGFFNREPVDADGNYRIQRPVGNLTLAIDLWPVPLWPRSALDDQHHFPHALNSPARLWDDRLFVPIEVLPGKTIQREIRIPITKLGEVQVNWLGAADVGDLAYSLTVQTGDVIFSCRRPSFREPSTETIEKAIPQVPVGRRIMILRGDDYCGYQESVPGETNTVFTFDPSQAGSLTGTVRLATGRAAGEAHVELLHPMLAEIGRVRTMRATYGIQPGAPVGVTKTTDEGTFRFPQVAPGQYVVRAAHDGKTVRQAVTIGKGAQTSSELVLQNEPQQRSD